MEKTMEAWENEGGAHESLGHVAVHKPVSHGTLLVGMLYAVTIIVVLSIVSRL